MISVVLCSFNGNDFIIEQLESIKNQSVKVDEVIIQDDNSSDKTVELCRKYIEENKLDSWRIYVNEVSLKVYKNFMSALKKANGDIIFLSDQDDIWEENKVEEMLKCFEENQEILSIASTFSRMNREGMTIEERVFHPHSKEDKIKQITKKEFYNFYNYLGMSMAVKKEVIEMIDTKNTYNQSFDITINYYALINNGFFYLDKPLTRRRSYSESCSNKGLEIERQKKYAGNSRIQYLDRKKKSFQGFLEILKEKGMKKDLELEKMIRQIDIRIQYIKDRNFIRYFINIVNINKYESIKEYVKDGKFIIKKEKKFVK